MSYESENRLKIFSSVVVKPVQTGFVIPTGNTIMPQGYQYQWIDVPHEEVVQAVRKPTRDYVRSQSLSGTEILQNLFRCKVTIRLRCKYAVTCKRWSLWNIGKNFNFLQSRSTPVYFFSRMWLVWMGLNSLWQIFCLGTFWFRTCAVRNLYAVSTGYFCQNLNPGIARKFWQSFFLYLTIFLSQPRQKRSAHSGLA